MFIDFFTLKKTKIILYLFIFVGIFLTIFWNLPIKLRVGENDDYIVNFTKFNQLNIYDEIASGTTVIYFLLLKCFNLILNNVNNSFFLLNLLSQILFIFLGVKMINKVESGNKKHKIIYVSILALFLAKSLQMSAFSMSSNDYLLSVFILWIIYEVMNNKQSIISDIKIGVFMGIAFSIRKSFILFFPLLFILVFDSFSLKNYIKTLGTIVFILLLFHFPAIIENHRLSFYSKEPPTDTYNWMTRNYLGLKRIFDEGLSFTNDNVWSYNWKMVEKYSKTGGFLPTSLTSVLLNDPIVLFKTFFHNIFRNTLWTIRFSGILTIAPFIFNFKSINKYLYAYYFFLITISLVGFTVTEFRWFWGYDFLMYLGGYFFVKELPEKKIYFVITVSLLLVLLFNIKTIITTF